MQSYCPQGRCAVVRDWYFGELNWNESVVDSRPYFGIRPKIQGYVI